jgi:hypothetical protein
MLVAIHQPNYLPWCGYFAKLAAADLFIFLDSVPMPNGRSFLSRTQILGPDGPQWLTVPTQRQPAARVAEARVAQGGWRARHLRTLQARYGHLPHGPQILAQLAPHYAEAPEERLATVNLRLLRTLVSLLGLRTPLICASQLIAAGQGSRHLLDLVRAAGGSAYLSGPSGQSYLDEKLFTQFGIPIHYGHYEPIAYPQRGCPAFVPGLSIVDALCSTGIEATRDRLLSYRRDR